MNRLIKSIALIACAFALAADAPPATAPIQVAVRDTAGRDVKVPAAQSPTILAFLRANQPQSADAIAQIRDVLSKQQGVAVVVALSGQNAPDAIKQFVASQKLTDWPIVLDPDYALSGKLAVHAWPTTVLVSQDGTQVAHLAGLPATFATDLSAYIDFAQKKIDQAGLQQRLTTRQVVENTPQQSATRHITIAQAMLDHGQVNEARAEIEQGLKDQSSDVTLKLMRVRVLLKSDQPAAALTALDEIKDGAPAWQLNQYRAQALIALQKWDEARTAVAEAVKLNPTPANAYYLTGVVCSHDADWQKAAEAFRKAYEATAAP